MKRFSILALAVAAAVSGCATTESQDTNAAAPAPQARSGQASSSPSTGNAPSSQVGSRGTGPAAASAGAQRPDLKRSVYYEFDKFDVKPEYRALVESHAAWLKANPKARLVIEGNADERGSREYNVALGQRRAESVTKMLVLMGARADQIEAVSWGEEKPRATGHDDSAWSENRRADFAQR
ncbi:MAG TPA: peptidoglycan-associated lipoprotein Pal [Burkholderiales bacterium]|jgi:peptidoglycan-associated lipoprotein